MLHLRSQAWFAAAQHDLFGGA